MDIQYQAINFLDLVFRNLEDQKIDIKNWEIDHLCYRTSSWENYLQKKIDFAELGLCLIESEVNGRPITTYKLHHPIIYKKWIIDLVEVPAPKLNKITKEGFEHIEVVIDESFDTLMQKNPDILFNTKGMNKELNPELEIEFENCALKFHHKSLEHIINIENHERIMKFLSDSKILSNLNRYQPCISGTLPLGIQHSQSDLDILFNANDLQEFEAKAKEHFCNMKNYLSRTGLHNGEKSIVINFDYNNLPIELFCQHKSVYQQNANQHFLIEGRLIKILGIKFKKKITELKQSGIKTEPAFGFLLGLDEPYSDLIDLNKQSDLGLYELFYKKI